MKQREELEMWRSMYMRLFQGVEQAISTLVEAEQACEEIYVSAVPKGAAKAVPAGPSEAGAQTCEGSPSKP